jgi:hypothetical protein
MPKPVSYILAYLVVASLTFGYVYNKNWYANGCDVPSDRYRYNCQGPNAELGPLVAGVVWPFYWLGVFGLTVTDMGR